MRKTNPNGSGPWSVVSSRWEDRSCETNPIWPGGAERSRDFGAKTKPIGGPAKLDAEADEPRDAHGRDGRGTHGQDAHATELPGGGAMAIVRNKANSPAGSISYYFTIVWSG
jgi:hypothetical protein